MPISDEALQRLRSFPLVDALLGRRSRHFGRGMSIPSGPLAYTSEHAPQPLSEEERLLLIALGAGVNGWNLGIPHNETNDPRVGCSYALRPVGRTYPSGAAAHGSELLITDDSGSYMTQLRDFDPSAIQQHADDSGRQSLERALALVQRHVVRLSDERVELPRAYPHIGTHNRWVANQAGSTLFVPVADQVETLLNLLFIYTSEGSPIFDAEHGRLLGEPAQLFAAGELSERYAVSLAEVEAVAVKHTTAELSIAAYNIQLALQAMGLGGWIYTGIHAGSLLGAYAADGVKGFGFRVQAPRAGGEPWPLGIDGRFEPLVPPYVRDMREAVQRFLARRFGAGGTYDPAKPGPFADTAAVRGAMAPPSPALSAYLGSLAQDIYALHGRFPATVPAVNAALYAQAQHIDLAFYDRFYAPGAYLHTHAEHDAVWHGREGEP